MENLTKHNSVPTNKKGCTDINSGGDFIRKNSNDNISLKRKENSGCCGNCSNYGSLNEPNINDLKTIPSQHLMVYERASLLYDEMENSIKAWPSSNCNGNIDGAIVDRNNWIHTNRVHLPSRCCYNTNSCLNTYNNNCQCSNFSNYYGSPELNTPKYSQQRINNFIAKHDDKNENKPKVYAIVYVSLLIIALCNWLINSIEYNLEYMKIRLGKFLNTSWNICDSSITTKNNKSIQFGLLLLSPILMILGGVYSFLCLCISVHKIIIGPVPARLMKVFNLKYLLNTVE